MRHGSMRSSDFETYRSQLFNIVCHSAQENSFSPSSSAIKSAPFSPTSKADEYVFVPRLSYMRHCQSVGKICNTEHERTGQILRSTHFKFVVPDSTRTSTFILRKQRWNTCHRHSSARQRHHRPHGASLLCIIRIRTLHTYIVL